jgi:copper(I)-binding protein
VTASRISRRTSRPGAYRLRLAATTLLAGLAALVTVTACSAGQYAQTANQVPGVPGTNVNVGPGGTIQLRNVVIAYNDPAGYPAGASAPLIVRIFNNGQTSVALTAVESPDYANSVVLTSGSPSAAAPTPPPPSPAPTASPTVTGTATPGAATATPGPTDSITLQAPAPSSFPVNIPPGTWADLVPGQGQYLLLNTLTKPLMPGQSVAVTFHFADGTVATVPVPVDLPTAQVNHPTGQASEGVPQD